MTEKESNEQTDWERIHKEFANFAKICGESNLYKAFQFNEIIEKVVKMSNLSKEVVSKHLLSLIKVLLISPKVELIDRFGGNISINEENLQTFARNSDFGKIRFYDPLLLTKISNNDTINHLEIIYQNSDSETVRISCLNIINYLDRDKREHYKFFEYAAISDCNTDVQNTARKIVLINYSGKGIELFKHLAENCSTIKLNDLYRTIIYSFETIENTKISEYKAILKIIRERYYNDYKRDLQNC